MITEFAKEKVFWTKKMNLKLVKFMERKSHIWNPKHPKYTSVAMRDRTYSEFAAKYGNEFTGQAVKDRWTNIRSTFSNYLRKIRNNKNKSNGEEYKVNWHLWEPCNFLLQVNKGVKPEYLETSTSEDVETKDNNFLFEECDNSEEYILDRSTLSCKSIAKNLATILRNVQIETFDSDNTKYGVVGRTVTQKLNQLDSFRSAEIVQKISDILLLYDANNPMNPNNFKSESL